MEAMSSGKTAEIKNSTEPYIREFLTHLVEAKAADKLHIEKGIDQKRFDDEVTHYEGEKEPEYINVT